MKKYIFIGFFGLFIATFALKAWTLAGLTGLSWFGWIAFENYQRTRFRFLRGNGFVESSFELGAEAVQMEIAADGSCAAFTTMDGMLSMRLADGREQWRRPLESGTLTVLPVEGGKCYYALGDELILLDERGSVVRRTPFQAPPFRQSYRLQLCANGMVLMLHTPWFLQFFSPDLGMDGGRISCEETGHYMKYCGLSGAGDRVFFAGAKLLEEEQKTEARWGSWKREEGVWLADWSQSEEHYSNSHLRSASISTDGSRLTLELFRDSYEIRVFRADGSLRFRRERAEYPCLSPDGGVMVWESPPNGLQASGDEGKTKLWTLKLTAKVRHKALGNLGNCLILEGRHFMKIGPDGTTKWEAWFQNDPNRLVASADGFSMALVRDHKGAILRLSAS